MALNKFYKRATISALEQQVGNALVDIEGSNSELKSALKFVFISSVKDYTQQSGSKKQVYLVLIPYPCLKAYNKVSKKLIPELERRVKGTILVAAKRIIQSKWIKQHRSQQRPRSRTLSAVYDSLLEDLVTPGTVIGRRIRVRVDGTKFFRVFLDQADQKELENRVDAIHGVYKALTTREVQFEFRQDYTFYQLKQKKKSTPTA